MENYNMTHHYKNKVHKILVHSYSVYFFLLLLGICLDIIFSLKIFNDSVAVPVGVLLLMLGTILIFWSQKTSRNLKKEEISKETFSQGPYRFTRTPTNFGLFFLVFGFGVILNAFFVVLTTFISFLIAKFVFLKKQEIILAEKYGVPYLEYKKSVKF
jgi:protein-S-isoprenylcysteine O-methyltransferase Ste14